MEGIILIIIIGLISKYFSKIKEYTEEKGFGQPGMPPFPKGRPSFEDMYDEYDEYDEFPANATIKSQSKIEQMEKEDSITQTQKTYQDEPNKIGIQKEKDYQPQIIKNENYTNNEDGIYLDSEDYLEDLFHIDNVKRGIIWQEILEEPRARRPYGRL